MPLAARFAKAFVGLAPSLLFFVVLLMVTKSLGVGWVYWVVLGIDYFFVPAGEHRFKRLLQLLARIVAIPGLVLLFALSKTLFDRAMRSLGWPHQDIVLEGKLYLRRFYLTPPSWRGRVFLHHILEPDAGRDVHDHPWPFVSVTLGGGYDELVVYVRGYGATELRQTKIGSVLFNPATHVHRILRVLPNTWTLVFAGQTTRSWGFWTTEDDRNFTFIDHHDYLNVGESEDWAEDRIQKKVV